MGIPEVVGSAFRRVNAVAGVRRGGVITQGSFLAGHSTGTDPHPIKRGVWLKDRLLDDPPPPPPPDVPALEVAKGDFAKMSVTELMELHRKDAACYDCHQNIDPWGLALQDYNAAGLLQPTKGDARVTLPDGRSIDGAEALKALPAAEKRDAFVRGMVRQLARYGLGRSLSFTDEQELSQITKQTLEQDCGLQDLIVTLVTSPLFSQK